MSKKLISNVCKAAFACLLRYVVYKPPQNAKLKGVEMGAKAVLNAVSVMDSSELPLDKEVIKFEILPPGHEATNIDSHGYHWSYVIV